MNNPFFHHLFIFRLYVKNIITIPDVLKNNSLFLQSCIENQRYDLIDKFIELDEAGYKFDYYNPNNFLLDEDKGSIEIIDLDKYKAPYKNDLGNALWALTNIEYLNTYLSSYDESSHLISDNDKNEAVGNTIEVISKYTKALQNKGKKYSSDGYEFMTQLFESYPMSFYLKTLDRSEKLQKLKDMGVMD